MVFLFHHLLYINEYNPLLVELSTGGLIMVLLFHHHLCMDDNDDDA